MILCKVLVYIFYWTTCVYQIPMEVYDAFQYFENFHNP